MKRNLFQVAALSAAMAAAGAFAQPIKVAQIVELSGQGTVSGTQFRNGGKMAINEINAAGGILGRQIQTVELDTQSQPAIAKAMTVKAIDDGAVTIFGPVFSGSILVSMAESQRAGIPNFTGGEASTITTKNNPYIFRTSFNQAEVMPKVANYLVNDLKAKSVVVVYINNDVGKSSRDAIINELTKRGVKIADDISTDPAQVDYSAAVLRAKQANADAFFTYLNEEESARLLRELRKQGYDKPIVGETTLIGAKVVELAGTAANGARGHVGLTAEAPTALVRAYAQRYESAFKGVSDHNGIKGYTGMYLFKAAVEKAGKVDPKAIADAIRNSCFSAKDHPGILMDVCYDDKGDIDRESFLVEVKNGKQEVTAVLPPLKPRK